MEKTMENRSPKRICISCNKSTRGGMVKAGSYTVVPEEVKGLG
jgi:hypothetical protein